MLLLLACSTPEPDEPTEPEVHALEDGTWTTLQSRWAPLVPSEDTIEAIDDGSLSVFDWQDFGDWGLGVEEEEGSSWIDHDELAPDFEEGSDRRSVALIWQAADPQVIDEESPIRLSAWADLYRPQGHLSAHAWEAHVRTAARIEGLARPFDFALLAGDLTDGGQRNELEWVLTAVNGGVIDPDSGKDDDTSFNHPFESVGLGAPWYAAVGNHDVLYIGGFDAVTDELREAAVGEEVYDFPVFANGFRDGSSEGAEVCEEGPTPADPDRVPLDLSEFLAALAAAGHIETQTGWYTERPVPELPVRLIVLNTVNDQPEGMGIGAQGYIALEQLEWLGETLNSAAEDGELVVVMSHHRAKDLGSQSPVSEEDLIAELAHPALVLHVTGHGHTNTDHLHSGEHGYWELMLASTVDFPIQSRVIELVDEGNGFLSIYCTNLDHLSPPGSPAHSARELAAAKYAFPILGQTPDVARAWASDVDSQNLLLRLSLTEAQIAALDEADLPEDIMSIEVLGALSR
ncbi:MAG TPA: metallophosphoesterase [Myxococcota bacterium]|nr:metallophosphoesterase [Myxococcota bacterium]